MKTIYNVKALCVLAFLGGAAVAHAQEDTSKEKNLNREMTLEREYDPSVQDASKVNTLPEVKEPEARKIPIDYASFTVPAEPEKEIGVLPAGNVMTQMDYNKRRGYFNFGGGTHLNLNGDLGYHILSTDKDRLNIWYSHRSTNGNVKYLQEEVKDEKVKAKLNDNLGGINFRHNFEKMSLSLGAKYGYSAFNYYGLPIYSASGLPMADRIQQIKDNETQANQTIQFNLGFESEEEASFGYLLDLGFTNFSHKKGIYPDTDGPKENTFEAKFDLSAGFNGDMRVGLGGQVEYFNYSLPGGDLEYEFQNHAEIMLSPYYKVEGDSWHVKLGANAMMATGEENTFMASPNVAAGVEVADKTELYLNAGGKMYSNSMYETARLNRYFFQANELLPSRNWLDATVGLRSGVAPGFWFDLFGGYKITSDDVFHIPSVYVDGLGTTYGALQFDSKQAFGGVSLKYCYQQIVELRLKGVYNSWKVETDLDGDIPVEAYGKPEMELTAGVTVRPISQLALDLNYNLQTGRKAYVLNEVLDMNNINELNLTGSYTFNDTFGVYAKLNNILCQKYEQYYGYPMQSFSALVGVNINF